eukprot:PhF_6_TR29238/c0_g1_i1/m.42794
MSNFKLSDTMSRKAVREAFPGDIRHHWPSGYAPTKTAAQFMYPGGISIQEVMKLRTSRQQSPQIMNDLSTDYHVWLRSLFEDYVTVLPQVHKNLIKLTARNRLPREDTVLEAFVMKRWWREKPYFFRSYAMGQEIAMKVVDDAKDGIIHFKDYPTLFNVLNTSYHSFTPATYFLKACGDPFFITREFISELALYLASRVEALGSKPNSILFVFSNGRIGHFLNESNIVQVPVVSWSKPGKKKARAGSLTSLKGIDPEWEREFPLDTDSTTITQALLRHEPQIVVMEPHFDKDWTTEVRGFHSVREVMYLGPVNGPAMGSFTYPYLSFGVVPGRNTYYVYGENLKIREELNKGSVPMDPPYVLQGYEEKPTYVDDVSKHMISQNESSVYYNTTRCMVHRRISPATPPLPNSTSEK